MRILSPSRAELAAGLTPLLPAPAYVPLSVTPAATLSLSLLLAGCAALFLLVRDIAARAAAHPWLPALPLVALAVLEAALGVAQFLDSGAQSTAHGTFAIRNHFAGFLAMVFPFPVMYGLASLPRFGPPRPASLASGLRSSLGFVLAALLLLAIFCPLSRGGFLAVLGSLILMTFAAADPRLTRRR